MDHVVSCDPVPRAHVGTGMCCAVFLILLLNAADSLLYLHSHSHLARPTVINDRGLYESICGPGRVKPRIRSNSVLECVWDANVRSQEPFPHDGGDFRDRDTMRKNTIFSAADASNRAKALEIGRATRAPQEGAVGPLSTVCTPHPPCIMP